MCTTSDLNKNITSTPFSCIKDGLTIRGHMFRPADIAPETKLPAVILSHGFLADETSNFIWAEYIASLGYAAFTFDFNGGGIKCTSDGKSEDMTVLTEKQDLIAVLEYVKGVSSVDADRMTLLGASQGGFVSAMVAAELKATIKGLILFYPALCIPDDARSGNMLFIHFDPAAIPAHIAEEPMKIGGVYAEVAQKLNSYEEIAGYEGKTLLIHGTADDVVNISYSRKAVPLYENLTYKEIEGAGHCFDNHMETVCPLIKEFLEN